jgi:hypothetical protein
MQAIAARRGLAALLDLADNDVDNASPNATSSSSAASSSTTTTSLLASASSSTATTTTTTAAVNPALRALGNNERKSRNHVSSFDRFKRRNTTHRHGRSTLAGAAGIVVDIIDDDDSVAHHAAHAARALLDADRPLALTHIVVVVVVHHTRHHVVVVDIDIVDDVDEHQRDVVDRRPRCRHAEHRRRFVGCDWCQ